MATAPATSNRSGQGAELLKASAQQLLQTVIANLATTASNKIDEVVDKIGDVAAADLGDLAASGGPLTTAGLGAVRAVMSGKNPVWAALRGAWSGTSTKIKVVIVLCLVLILLLAPVFLVGVLLGLLIAAIVAAIRSATR